MVAKTLIYDGTFDGFLSSVFYSFEFKLTDVIIQNKFAQQNSLFSDSVLIITDETKASRVWTGLKAKLSSRGCSQLYYAFFSEQIKIEKILLDVIQYAFKSANNIDKDYTRPSVLKMAQIAKMVGREKHRMEAFIRFKLTKDNIYFANVEPDFNVLPLISSHFKKRYADQKWIIYDTKRHYGLSYDLIRVNFIEMEFLRNFDFSKTETEYFSPEEFDFQTLWKDYFSSTNIASRKNMKLHIRHVPKRYWKYLIEKQS